MNNILIILLSTLLLFLSSNNSSNKLDSILTDYYYILDSLEIETYDSIKFIGIKPLNFDSIYECDFPINGVTLINKFNDIWMTEVQINTAVIDGTELKFTVYHELTHALFLAEHEKTGLMQEYYDPEIKNIDSLLIEFLKRK